MGWPFSERADDTMEDGEVIDRYRHARHIEQAIDDIYNIDVSTLQNGERIQELVTAVDQQDETTDPDEFFEYVGQDFLEEKDWLIPELASVAQLYRDNASYSEIVETIRPAAELLVSPTALTIEDNIYVEPGQEWRKLSDIPADDMIVRDDFEDKNPDWDWRSRRAWKHDNLLIHANKKKDHVHLQTMAMQGDNLLLQTSDIHLDDSILEGNNLLKRSEKTEINDSTLEGYNLLKNSTDTRIQDSVLLGHHTLRNTGYVSLQDSFVVGNSPLALDWYDHRGESRVQNTVIVGDSPFEHYENATVQHSIIAGNRPLKNADITLEDTYVVGPDRIEYYDSAKYPTAPDETWSIAEWEGQP